MAKRGSTARRGRSKGRPGFASVLERSSDPIEENSGPGREQDDPVEVSVAASEDEADQEVSGEAEVWGDREKVEIETALLNVLDVGANLGSARRLAASSRGADDGVARVRSGAPVMPDLPSPGQSNEAFRMVSGRLWTKIRRWADGRAFSLAITSPEPGTGKTLMAINVAGTLCETSGKSVLLVEGDLRRPSFGNYFDFDSSEPTVSSLCRADVPDSDWRGQPVEGMALEILPAGDPEPGDNLSADRLEWLVATALTKYSLVIFDAPPLPVASALRITEYCDGTLLVVRRNYTRQADLATALNELSAERVMGLAFSRENPRRVSMNDYY